MLNQVVLVGRLVYDPVLREASTGKKISSIRLAVPRSYRNVDGYYETDFIDCILFDNAAKSTVEYCKKGDIVSIKGRVQSKNDPDGEHKNMLDIIVEKISFLSNHRADKKECGNLESPSV